MIVDCAVYDRGVQIARNAAIAGVRGAGRSESSFVWVALVEPTAEEFAAVSSEFDLHELAVEDAVKAHPAVPGLIAVACTVLYVRFRRSGWL